jgi:hypothetical protein
MIGEYDFSKDLPKGESAQHWVYEAFKKRFPHAKESKGYNRGWDIKIGETKFEVKRDFRSHETGNYFVETAYSGIDSGIVTTESDFYVLVDNDFVIIIPTETLRFAIKDIKEFSYPPKGRDGIRTGKLVSREKIKFYGKVWERN